MSFQGKRKYRKTIVHFQSKFKPQEIWEFLVHPKHVVKFTKDPCYYCEISNDFVLEKKHFWTEVHTGKDCEGDIVKSVIIGLKQYQSFSTLRHQAGIKNKTILTLTENESGTLISEEQIFSPSFKSVSLLGLFAWLMLLTGMLTRFSFQPDDDLFWFERMEETVANTQLASSETSN